MTDDIFLFPSHEEMKSERAKEKFREAVTLYGKDYVRLAEHFSKIQPYCYDKSGIWWLWNDELKCWEMIDEVDLINLLRNNAPPYFNLTKSEIWNEIIKSMKLIGRTKQPDKIPSGIIQLKDKCYNIFTNEIIIANPKFFNVNPIPYGFSNSDLTPTMDRIFEEWVGKDYVKTLYQIIAYCMLPEYPLHRLFCLTGSGSNGKSKYLALIRKFIGENNYTSAELDSLISNRFESAKLFKKLVCTMGETNFNVLKNTGTIKKLTGDDAISFEFKNKNPFIEMNYAKIIIATNSLPATADKTDGFYRRWLIVDFPNKFSEKKDILSEIPEEEYSNLATKSLKLLKELLEIREFHNEGSFEERKKKYEDSSNPLLMFVNEHCDKDIHGAILSTEFINKAGAYLVAKGKRPMSWKDEMLPLLRNMGVERDRIRLTDYQNPMHCIVGLSWKTIKNEVKIEDCATCATKTTSFTPCTLSQLPNRNDGTAGCGGTKDNHLLENQEKKDFFSPILNNLSKSLLISFTDLQKKTDCEESALLTILTDLEEKGEIYQPVAGFYLLR